MGLTNLGTLNKLNYTTLTQFIDDINRNFAVVQNSPLFKGIPGIEAEPGSIGPKGERGSKIFFIDFIKFNTQFPTEITLSNQIDLVFLNSKLNDLNEKTKILNAIESPNLVDKDIFVLTNSLLISYNYSENVFHDTGASLNNSVTNEIQTIINNLFQAYLPILQASITNVFQTYSTLAKNYSDNNNGGITNGVNQTSVYSPFIPGVTANLGIPIDNHKYYGVGQSTNTEETDNTVVFGSIVKYYKMLMNTLNTDGSQTLTSNYAPGVNNIPAGIFMQDTYNNGLLFGFKGKNNLKTFGSIFKNDSDELEIKSDSGKLESDYSSIKLHKNRLRYNKIVEFGNSLTVSQNLTLGGIIDNHNIKTGIKAFEENIDLFDILDPNTIDKSNIVSINNRLETILVRPIPNTTNNKYLINHANNIYLRATNYSDRVLVTNTNGLISSDFKIEKKVILDYSNTTTFTNLLELTDGVATNKLLTSYYYNYLVRKINLLFNTQLNGLYWTKQEFNSNIIPSLKLNDNLVVDRSASLAGVANFNSSNGKILLNPTNLLIDSEVSFKKHLDKVLVSDTLGQITKDVVMDYNKFSNNFPIDNSITSFPLLETSPRQYDVITKYHYNNLIKYLNIIGSSLIGNYWTKSEFETYTIPNLNVNNGLFTKKYLAVGNNLTSSGNNGDFLNDNTHTFYSDAQNKTTFLGGNSTSLFSDINQIKGFNSNQILGTSGTKKTYLGSSIGNIVPINMIGSLASITSTTYNLLNNQPNRTLADNKTVASLILGITTSYDNLKNYIDSQISILNQQLTQQINDLATDVYTKIQTINNDLINIHNELSTKATISYVDGHVANINQNINNINNVLTQHTNDIINIQQALLTKVDKSSYEPWKATVDDFMSKSVKFPKGGIILWEGKLVGGLITESIPEGWEEVTSMRGRTPVGWTNGAYMDFSKFYGKFTVLGEEDGYANIILSEDHLPKHRFSIFGGWGTNGSGISNGDLEYYADWAPAFAGDGSPGADWNYKITKADDNNARFGKTNWVGNGVAHNNTQPYKTVIFLRALNGY